MKKRCHRFHFCKFPGSREKTALARTDLLQYREGGGCLALFGAPFLLAGLFLIQIPLGLIPVRAEGDPVPPIVLILFGGAFTAAGLSLMFGRKGLTIDRRLGMVERWWGLLVPMRIKRYHLHELESVRLSYDSGDSDSSGTYPVRLVRRFSDETLPVRQPADYQKARQLAEEIAAFLGIPLEDVSAGAPLIREPGRLGETLRERVLRTGEDIRTLPPEPADMRTRIRKSDEGWVLEIPGPRRGVLNFIPLAFVLVFAGVVAGIFLPALMLLPWPMAVRFGLISLIAVFFVLLPVWGALRDMLRARKDRTVVTVTPVSLKVEEIRHGKRVSEEIFSDELEDLVLPTGRTIMEEGRWSRQLQSRSLGDTGILRLPDGRPAPGLMQKLVKYVGLPGITALSRSRRVTFGKGLDEAELLYLRALIRRIIAGGETAW